MVDKIVNKKEKSYNLYFIYKSISKSNMFGNCFKYKWTKKEIWSWTSKRSTNITWTQLKKTPKTNFCSTLCIENLK